MVLDVILFHNYYKKWIILKLLKYLCLDLKLIQHLFQLKKEEENQNCISLVQVVHIRYLLFRMNIENYLKN